ncbi:hypothetical protein D3C85_1692060 [compost metagenome]
MLQLARISFARDIRHSKGDNSHRYSVLGLGDGKGLFHEEDMDFREGSFFMSPMEIFPDDEQDEQPQLEPAPAPAESRRSQRALIRAGRVPLVATTPPGQAPSET